jgi:hypothetical protein
MHTFDAMFSTGQKTVDSSDLHVIDGYVSTSHGYDPATRTCMALHACTYCTKEATTLGHLGK